MAKKVTLALRTTIATICAFLLCAILAVFVFGAPNKSMADETDPAEAEGVSQWDGDLISAGWGETADKVKPTDYEETPGENGKLVVTIGSAAAFAYFSHEVYTDTEHRLAGATVNLTTDINLAKNMWVPIGQTNRESAHSTINFSGTFNGGGHTIWNFYSEKYFAGLRHDTEDKYHIIYERKGIAGKEDKITEKIPFAVKSGEEYSYGLFASTKDITVKNLKIKNIDLSFAIYDFTDDENGDCKDYHTHDGTTIKDATHEIMPDSIGVIAGIVTGSATFEKCVVGSSEATQSNKLYAAEGSAIGGLIGRVYTYAPDGTYKSNCGSISVTDCINYVNLTFGGKAIKGGGILGYSSYSQNSVIKNCTNYGNITGGITVGGITSYYIPNANLTKHLYEISNCDNYGNIVSWKNDVKSDVGGIMSYITSQVSNKENTLKIAGCNNYGNIAGNNRVGGITPYFERNGNTITYLTDNYNYGDIYSYGYTDSGSFTAASNAGGYIGRLYMITAHMGGSNGKVVDGIAEISGGNLGKVYGTATNLKSVFGSKSITYYPENQQKLSEKFYINAGYFESKSKEQMDQTDVPPEHPTTVRNRRTAVATDDKFAYADENMTELIGVKEGASVVGKVEIPATVEKIGYAAFAGNSGITEIVFADSNLRSAGELEIDDLAFAATGITKLNLPAKVTKIGAGAFASCNDLNHVVLSANAKNIALGTGAFTNTRVGTSEQYLGAFLIASGNDQYWELRGSHKYDEYLDTLTYEMAITFVFDGVKQGDPVKKLHGQSYNVYFDEGESDLWKGGSDLPFGPKGDEVVWYSKDNAAYTSANANDLLLLEEEEVTLNAYTEGKTVFIARNDLVYNSNKSYAVNELNALLHAASSKLTSEMTATITGFNGSNTNLPTVFHNAGTYEVTVNVPAESAPLVFNLTIAKETLDLSNLSNLEWNIIQIGEDEDANVQKNVNAPLMSYTIYLYTYTAQSGKTGKYPSRDVLDAAQIAELKLNRGYETVYVDYSVARNRGSQVTLGIRGEGYTATYPDDAEDYAGTATHRADEVGVYTANAILEADDNHVFTVGGISALRGMQIQLGESADHSVDNTKATVTKTWYLVDISNWVIVSGGANAGMDYFVSDRVYNTAQTVDIPRPYYGSADAITMHLFRNGVEVEGPAGFGVNRIREFINAAMPVGDYSLRIDIAGLESEDEDRTLVWHNPVSETFTFTVDKAEFPSPAALTALVTAFNNGGNPFVYDLEDNDIYGSEVEAALNAIKNMQGINPDREGTVWAQAKYGELYGSFIIKYNLARWYNDSYYENLNYDGEHPLGPDPDTYTVYYQIYAPNYYSNIDNGDRFTYKFTLVKYKTLSVPDVNDEGLYYTGSKVLPTIDENKLYSIVWDEDDDYIAGGDNNHSVYFVLNDSLHYRWAGVNGDTAEKTFSIRKADNDFIIAPSILGWSFQTFDANVNTIRVAAKFLDSGEKIHFRVTKDGETAAQAGLGDFFIDANGKVVNVNGQEDAELIGHLNELPTGKYNLYAKITGTSNYNDYERFITFAVTKANNSWKDGNDDLVLPGWIVGNYDEEENIIVVKAAHGITNIIITDMDGNEYYNSVTGVNKLNDCPVGKYLLKAWVDETEDFAALAERTFTIEVFEKAGLPWWATLVITLGALGIAALIIFILWKKGVFQILTEKITVAIRTKASVDATIAAVRAAKREEEAKKTVAAAEAKERAEARRAAAQAEREKPAEERAAALEAKAKAQAERAEKMRLRAEAMQARAARVREKGDAAKAKEAPAENPAEAQTEAEAAATETPTEE